MIKQLRLLFTMLLLTIVGSASADSYVKSHRRMTLLTGPT